MNNLSSKSVKIKPNSVLQKRVFFVLFKQFFDEQEKKYFYLKSERNFPCNAEIYALLIFPFFFFYRGDNQVHNSPQKVESGICKNLLGSHTPLVFVHAWKTETFQFPYQKSQNFFKLDFTITVNKLKVKFSFSSINK